MGNEDKTVDLPVSPMDEEEEEEYVVEEIIRHKITKKNKVEFYLKWKGFGESDNTWEPAENLNCPELIDAYLKGLPDKDRRKVRGVMGPLEDEAPQENGDAGTDEKKKQSKRKHTDESVPKKKKKSEKRANGFDKGYDAEEILGATETGGEVHFLIKWKGLNDAELVPSKTANTKIPQMVIAFYEARLTWSTVSGKSSDETDTIEEEPSKKETEVKAH